MVCHALCNTYKPILTTALEMDHAIPSPPNLSSSNDEGRFHNTMSFKL